MNITIVGAGNVGTQLATHCAEKGNDVIIFGSKPERVYRELTIVNEKYDIIHRGIIKKATSDAKEAFVYADLIFVTMPATMLKEVAEIILPYVKPGLLICIVPGTGGGECAFSKCIEKGATIFGVQRVPSVARLVEYGKIVRAVGYREEMFVSSIPNSETNKCCKIVEDILDIKTTALPNYLNITLTPSNPILHTTRLKNLFGDYYPGRVYSNVPLFYEDWNNESSDLLIKCDNEVQEICKALNTFDLTYTKSLRTHYESPDASAMTKKISSITGFKGIKSPVKKVENGFIPDFESRYFTADFPYGLSILLQIADFAGVNAKNMRETLEWYYKIVGKNTEFSFADYGIESYNDFISFYSK